MGSKGRRKIEKEYPINLICEKYYNLYHLVLNGEHFMKTFDHLLSEAGISRPYGYIFISAIIYKDVNLDGKKF